MEILGIEALQCNREAQRNRPLRNATGYDRSSLTDVLIAAANCKTVVRRGSYSTPGLSSRETACLALAFEKPIASPICCCDKPLSLAADRIFCRTFSRVSRLDVPMPSVYTYVGNPVKRASVLLFGRWSNGGSEHGTRAAPETH
jgi:hypothetical protein